MVSKGLVLEVYASHHIVRMLQTLSVSLVDLWRISGGFMVDLCRIYGGFMEDNDGFMVDLWMINERFPEDLWRIYGGFMDLWMINGSGHKSINPP